MSVQIVLLRGINVGEHNRLPMKDLRHIAIAAGAHTAQTYLQSGNLVIDGPGDINAIADAIQRLFGFRPLCLCRTREEWKNIIAENPYGSIMDPRLLHVFIMAEPTTISVADLNAIAAPDEQVCLTSGQAYLSTPGGISGSHIARRIERMAGVAMTSRNWRTACALMEIADGISSN